ncbi:MAG: radical SAM protein [Desulfobacterota bacterium]|nr:radical SAM protein [Thermodesulfobacteriota bacterium]MDW8001847.1 radical SAM protein [Deltaproteobacteria bacterium]
MKEEGFEQGKCQTFYNGSLKKSDVACRVTLKWENHTPYRLITASLLSRPEDYLSIYQSGCNLSCLKCHSWEFTKFKKGRWTSPDDVAEWAKRYAEIVTVREPRDRATSFHAHDLCHHCGTCVRSNKRSAICPNRLEPNQILLSFQGYGPARNIVSFTGGDLACNPEWYLLAAERIKEMDLGLWVLFETNGYGLTRGNLDKMRRSGIDSFWLDIKAYDPEVHKKLTGVDNRWILRLPEEILARGFVLEVLTLFIPGWVEIDEIKMISKHLSKIDPRIPFTILAFFGEYKLKNNPSPTFEQMILAYKVAKDAGLVNVRLGNLGQFVRNQKEYMTVLKLNAETFC